MSDEMMIADRRDNPEPIVCSIVLAFGSESELFNCISALVCQEGIQQHIIVVQNGARLSLMDDLEETFSALEVIRNGENVGAAAGRNIGIRKAARYDADYIFLADNDAVVTPNAVHELVRASEDRPDAGFLSSLVYRKSQPEKIFSAGAFVQPPLDTIHLYQIDAGSTAIEVDFAPSLAMLVPMTTIRRVGLMDERLFVYDEDLDWCLRGCECGLKTIVITSSLAYHDTTPQKRASPRRIYYGTRNRLVVANRYGFFSSILEWKVARRLAQRFFGRLVQRGDLSFTGASAHLVAVTHFLWGRLGQCPSFLNHPYEGFVEGRIRRRLRRMLLSRIPTWIKQGVQRLRE